MLNNIVSIFDPKTNEELKYGEEGEICVLSSTFMLGYYNDINSTNAVIKTHKDGKKWIHSGDLGYMNEDGHLFVKGRMKRVISLYTGNKIFPSELETLIEMIDEVEKAVIVPEEDNLHPGFVKPCLFVTLNKEISQTELKQKVDEALSGLPDYTRINTIHVREKLPTTAIGKIDLKGLEEEAMILSKKKQ